ncbi:hypothetical protein DICPUDRAFT_160427, partial [Dictyostelium purpureum]
MNPKVLHQLCRKGQTSSSIFIAGSYRQCCYVSACYQQTRFISRNDPVKIIKKIIQNIVC